MDDSASRKKPHHAHDNIPEVLSQRDIARLETIRPHRVPPHIHVHVHFSDRSWYRARGTRFNDRAGGFLEVEGC